MMKFGLEEDFNKTDLEERVEILFLYLVKGKSGRAIAEEYYHNVNYAWKISAVAQGYCERGGSSRGKYACTRENIQDFVKSYPSGTYHLDIRLQDFLENVKRDNLSGRKSIFVPDTNQVSRPIDVSKVAEYKEYDISIGEYYLITPEGVDFSVHETTHMSIKADISFCESETGVDVQHTELASYIAFMHKESKKDHSMRFIGFTKLYKYDKDLFHSIICFLFNEYLSHHKDYIEKIITSKSIENYSEKDLYRLCVANLLVDTEGVLEKLGYTFEDAEVCYIIKKLLYNNVSLKEIDKFVYHLSCQYDVCVLNDNDAREPNKRIKQNYQRLIEACIAEYRKSGETTYTCETAVLIANDWPEESRELIRKFSGVFAEKGYIDLKGTGSEISDSIKKNDLTIIYRLEEALDFKISQDVLFNLRKFAVKGR